MDCKNKSYDVLNALSAEILAADPADKDAVVGIGSSLEGFLDKADGMPAELEKLFSVALELLQCVYGESLPDPAAAMEAVATAVSAAAEFLADGGDSQSLQAVAATMQKMLSLSKDGDAPAAASQPDNQPQKPQATNAPAQNTTSETNLLPGDTDMDLLSEFIVECLDHIAAAEAALLELESNPDDAEQINTIFRAFHTIKGTSGFLGLNLVQNLAHKAENLLDRARDGEIKIQGGYADLALKSSDALRTMISGLEGVKPGDKLTPPAYYDDLMTQLADPEAAGISDEANVEDMRLGDILVGKGQAKRSQVEAAAKKQGSQRIGQVLVENNIATAGEVIDAVRTQKKISGRQTGENTIRVGTDRLDNLVNMVGELVIAHSMVTQDPDVCNNASPRLARNVSHAGKIIRELQDLAMSLRMVPLKGTFQKMNRLVRDLARKAGKSVQFITEGEETEIDRTMVETLGDPLVHMMRNAVDHGIETAEVRKARGKSGTGTITLRAYHSAGNVVIELQDDGKGLDKDKIIAKAVERGLIESAKDMTESEVFALIFQAGFSTAEKVTDISGRGVGMDVVKRGIESLRGKIELASKLNKGTTFTVRLPLTMAITDAMLIRVGSERYLLPTISIERSFRPEAGAISTVVGRGEVIMVRGDLLPVFRLHKLFRVPNAETDPQRGLLIIIESDEKRCALMVDELLGQQQVVIKSLGESLGQIPGVSGGAILGNGRVGLILDAAGLTKLAHDNDSDDLLDTFEDSPHRNAAVAAYASTENSNNS